VVYLGAEFCYHHVYAEWFIYDAAVFCTFQLLLSSFLLLLFQKLDSDLYKQSIINNVILCMVNKSWSVKSGVTIDSLCSTVKKVVVKKGILAIKCLVLFVCLLSNVVC